MRAICSSVSFGNVASGVVAAISEGGTIVGLSNHSRLMSELTVVVHDHPVPKIERSPRRRSFVAPCGSGFSPTGQAEARPHIFPACPLTPTAFPDAV